jgi:hypothetical protein
VQNRPTPDIAPNSIDEDPDNNDTRGKTQNNREEKTILI